MGSRLDFQSVLENLLGSRNVYFQPPEDSKMSYPCIVYSYNDLSAIFADNKPYIKNNRYQIIIMDIDVDSSITERISNLSLTTFDRFFTSNNLNHWVYNTYF